ncbi:hypothetical protein IWZ01DRAFT_135153 [Phyllosticta capitalensis]
MARCEVRSAVGFGGSVLVQTLYPIELVCLFSNEMSAATRSFDGLFGDLASKFLFSAPCPIFSLSVSSGSIHQQMDRRGFGDGVRKRLRIPLSFLCVVEISSSNIAGPGPHPDLQVRRPLQISCSTPQWITMGWPSLHCGAVLRGGCQHTRVGPSTLHWMACLCLKESPAIRKYSIRVEVSKFKPVFALTHRILVGTKLTKACNPDSMRFQSSLAK